MADIFVGLRTQIHEQFSLVACYLSVGYLHGNFCTNNFCIRNNKTFNLDIFIYRNHIKGAIVCVVPYTIALTIC